MTRSPVVVLAGGVGAARFLRGLVQVVPADEIVVIGNTGDDMWWKSLYISPDLDTVTYWLAGLADTGRGWGIRGDTFTAQRALEGLSDLAWFQLGDRDLATHLYRTTRMGQGATLSIVTAELAARQGVACRVLPMTDQAVTTRLKTEIGDLHFQEYFVREGCRPAVQQVYWTGLDQAVPAPGVIESIREARLVLIAPSNPIISIGPILRVPGVRAALQSVRERSIAVSPLIGGRAIKGPTVALMRAEGVRPDALGVAQLYRDVAAGFVLDSIDAQLRAGIIELGYKVATLSTLLDDPSDARTVASSALGLISEPTAA
ncbi:MAG: 2-phospho-L-lactate transferase [Candidatus Dormibacteria bacterium]